ncbi:MAG TPA: NAD(P)-binding domain-containing protein [Ilumatobacteraceae bacterium]|nr:NAD(P)-binding domain-containing protein [Ilumatobacteraceae bacterium]
MSRTTGAVVIGAGHAGLAMSRCLSARSVDHVVLERGEIANTWKTERWDSLRLLTPNWQSRLPGYSYQGDDPDGFMTMPQVIAFLERYAAVVEAPVHLGTAVTRVSPTTDGYSVTTDDGTWTAPAVVVATGACNVASIPKLVSDVPAGIDMVTPTEYRNPSQLADGGVLVVGASATGIQLADEIHRSGRQVTVAVGGHVRAPRTYRGLDVQRWMDDTGMLDESYQDVDDIVRVRRLPSLQIVGTPERTTLDLNALTSIGVRLIGRFAAISGGTAQFSGSLRNACALADLKLGRLLDSFDEWATEHGLDAELPPSSRPAPTVVEASPPLGIDLTRGDIRTIVWATGFRPDYSWLDVPVLDRKGMIRHDGGVVADAPGLYLMGMPFLRRRKSSLIDGAGPDAEDLSAHLTSFLDGHGPSSA